MKLPILICLIFASVVSCEAQTTNQPQMSLAKTLPATNRIEGQIYITRKDRETVKMSLVHVKIVEAKKCSEALDLISSYRKAKTNDTEWRRRASALVAAMPQMSRTNRNIADKTYAELSSMIKTNLPLAELGAKSSYELFREVDWQEECVVQTDADGNFSAVVPAGSWWIVALSKRKVVDDDEEYIWLEQIPDSHVGRIFLNNSNLLGK